MEELRRQAGWAKTFGLPLELISADEAKQMFPLMSTEGVLGRRMAANRRLHRPVPAHLRACRRRAARGRIAGVPEHPRHRDRGRRRPGPRRGHRAWADRRRGRRQRRRDVRRGDRADGGGPGPGDPVLAPVPGDAAVSRARRGRPAADPARSRPARLLPRGRRWPRDGRLRAPVRARVPARRARRLRADPAGLQRPAARGRLGPLRGDHRELEAPGPGDGRGQDHQADQRPRGVHPGQRVLPRRVRGARLLRRRRASAPTGSPARAGSAG